MTRTRTIVLTFALGLAAGAFACSPADGDLEFCEGKCDGEDLPFSKKIEKRFDPIAMMFKDGGIEIAEDSSGDVTYRDMVLAMADHQGCGSDSVKTFIISDDLFNPCPVECSEDDPDCKLCSDMTEEERISRKFPRLVSVVCANDAGKNWEFFLNSVSEIETEDGEPTGTIDPRNLEFFGWDPENKTYNFYATFPSDEGDSTFIEVEPQRCQQCHKTPSDTDPVGMPMTPIMNEINRPWTNWNAQTADQGPDEGFISHNWDLPPRFLADDDFNFILENWRAAAVDLEQIMIGGAFQKVSATRTFARRNPPTVDNVMGLLRPLFCAEQINYASEHGSGGAIFPTAVVDIGVRDAFSGLSSVEKPTEWKWFHNVTLSVDADGSESVNQVPIRGWADIVAQRLIVSGRIVSAQQALRARALSWKNPVFDEFRCNLWRNAYERYKAEGRDFGDATRVLSAAGPTFEDIMTIGGKSLDFGSNFLAIPKATPDVIAKLEASLAAGSIDQAECETDGFCLESPQSFGDSLQSYYAQFDGTSDARSKLRALRDERICHLSAEVTTDQPRFDEARANEEFIFRFMNAPALPPVVCE